MSLSDAGGARDSLRHLASPTGAPACGRRGGQAGWGLGEGAPPGGEDTSRDWVWEGWLIQGDVGVIQMTGTWAGEGSSWGED